MHLSSFTLLFTSLSLVLASPLNAPISPNSPRAYSPGNTTYPFPSGSGTAYPTGYPYPTGTGIFPTGGTFYPTGTGISPPTYPHPTGTGISPSSNTSSILTPPTPTATVTATYMTVTLAERKFQETITPQNIAINAREQEHHSWKHHEHPFPIGGSPNPTGTGGYPHGSGFPSGGFSRPTGGWARPTGAGGFEHGVRTFTRMVGPETTARGGDGSYKMGEKL